MTRPIRIPTGEGLCRGPDGRLGVNPEAIYPKIEVMVERVPGGDAEMARVSFLIDDEVMNVGPGMPLDRAMRRFYLWSGQALNPLPLPRRSWVRSSLLDDALLLCGAEE